MQRDMAAKGEERIGASKREDNSTIVCFHTGLK